MRNRKMEKRWWGDLHSDAIHPSKAVEVFHSFSDFDVDGVDGVSQTGQKNRDGDEKGNICTPVPTLVVSVETVRLVHLTDVELSLSDEVVVTTHDASEGAHETRISAEEGE
jgi:hypothetical protein